MLRMLFVASLVSVPALAGPSTPFDRQMAEKVAVLASSEHGAARAAAAEALGYLRAYDAAEALRDALGDPEPVVRREAALALAWCGGRDEVDALLMALEDPDWVVRQGAWVALTNLTGMEFPFDAQKIEDCAPCAEARAKKRRSLSGDVSRCMNPQVQAWRAWWAKASKETLPYDVLALLPDTRSAANLALGMDVAVSSKYKGSGKALTDGGTSSEFWQTKQVPFPQSCTVEFSTPRIISHVVIHQYGEGFCFTDYALQSSNDGTHFKEITRSKGKTEPVLTVAFEPRSMRYLRLVSFDTQNRTYPTTLYEIEAFAEAPPENSSFLAQERGLRALGALGGQGAATRIMETLAPYAERDAGTPDGRHMVQAGIRSLGRLGDPESVSFLIDLLDTPQWARYAADALGDCGGRAASRALLKAYPDYALTLDYRAPKKIPADDRPGLSPIDRMYETPFAIAAALARFPLKSREERRALAALTPLLMVNLPGDFDGAYLYDPEAHHAITRYLLERARCRKKVADILFATFNERAMSKSELTEAIKVAAGHWIADVPHAAAWLPTVCDKSDTKRLIAWLNHENGWVRMNAAKTLMFVEAERAVDPIATALAASKHESDYGYYGGFRFYQKQADGTDVDAHDEYDDPSPRWREAFIRVLGRMGHEEHVPLLENLMNDERNVLDIQYAAAMALDDLGTTNALDALAAIESTHPYLSVHTVAREALWRRNISVPTSVPPEYPQAATRRTQDATETGLPERIVFIKGPNKMPNDFQIDPWRQTYSTTDTGPTYRIGHNLYRLDAGQDPVALTNFTDGYVADCEVSWDGDRIIFAKRGGDTDPWWHIYEIHPDGSGMRQITDGPYHDVQPAYLPDGRIVFSSSRLGLRDEYHGYLATGLTVMNPDGSNIHTIALNVGRDNEPAILPDGRIVFSRLELFYSRLKTELTVHAVFPDGTKDVTLFGPEHRAYFRQVTRDAKEDWWGEVPGRHRVLRFTQPQAFNRDRIVCVTTAGITILGPGRERFEFVPHDKAMAVTSPFPLDDALLLCAATKKDYDQKGRAKRVPGDLGLYTLNTATGALDLIYNDPKTAEFEARPIRPRPRPQTLAPHPTARGNQYTAQLNCRSAFTTRDARVAERGKLVRVIEGQPITGRHRTHTALHENAWRNHTGTLARVLGTVPLSTDGSFNIEIPADRLIHLQVLDSDRRTVGNQLIWMYNRPGENKSCVGCHESPDSTSRVRLMGLPQAIAQKPIPCLPTGSEFSYRAKFWNKGELPDEGEERTRTVRAVSLLGRY